ncbi:unnamed protein product [Parnassius apollo]|uniref:(apollo) hypothetical protein n=1 Tax=Parnassius apollo TaxID=110799 RepID=A0A8S3WY35_PARAO|nr:unnamed protein product [Parnassius apollo]
MLQVRQYQAKGLCAPSGWRLLDIMQKLTERIDDLKQRIAAWSDQKRLYKSLERPIVSGTGPAPNQADMVVFWRSLWSEPVNHNEGPWTEVVASQCASITPMDPVIITPDDVAEAVRRAPNWKSPGLDGLHHYWLKGFMVCHSVLARQFQEALNQKSLPSLFTTGITHLVPKDQGATDPSKYRPITRLPASTSGQNISIDSDSNNVATAVLVEKPTEEDSTIIAVRDTSAADHVNVHDVCMAHTRAEDLEKLQTSTFFENVYDKSSYDLGNFMNKILSDNDKRQILDMEPLQPSGHFPTDINQKNRCFSNKIVLRFKF